MIKYSLLLLNLFGILSLQVFFDDGVIIEDNTPVSIQPGETVTVDITVNKGDIAGFAKLELVLPVGLKAAPVETTGASFTFSGQKAKFIWMTLPDNQEFTVSYNLTADPAAVGNLVIRGTFSYIKENQRVDYEMQSKLVAIGGEPATADNSTSDTDSENAGQSEALSCVRTTSKISDSEYLVNLKVINANLSGFAKIMEHIPSGYVITEEDSDGAITTIESTGVKYVWFEAPDLSEFEVTYRLKSFSSSNDPQISGAFSYIDDNTPIEIPIVDGGTEELIADSGDSNTDTSTDDTTTDSSSDTTSSDNTPDTSTDSAEDNNNTASDNTNQGDDKASDGDSVADNTENSDTDNSDTSSDNSSNDDTSAGTDNDSPGVTNVPDPETGISYRVQVVAGHNTVGKSYFKSRHSFSEQFTIEQHQGWVKYTTGSHPVYKDARDSRERIGSRYNFNGPFVTAYNDGVRITVQEALMISNQKWYQ